MIHCAAVHVYLKLKPPYKKRPLALQKQKKLCGMIDPKKNTIDGKTLLKKVIKLYSVINYLGNEVLQDLHRLLHLTRLAAVLTYKTSQCSQRKVVAVRRIISNLILISRKLEVNFALVLGSLTQQTFTLPGQNFC